VQPNARHDWVTQAVSDFEALIPIADKKTKSVRVAAQERAIFKTFSFGVVTNRDEWVYAETVEGLEPRVQLLISTYNNDRLRLKAVHDSKERAELLDRSIKWTRAVKRDLENGVAYHYDRKLIREALYRPYSKKLLYFSHQLNEMQNRMAEFFGRTARRKNPSVVFTDPTSQKPFMTLATDICPDMHLVGAAAGSVTLARSIEDDRSTDNVTDWALEEFRAHYKAVGKKLQRMITKDAIFHYVYGVLHDPIYREKYAQNLKREFPRIPFYADFWRWADWGKELMALHIGYESVEPWPLERIDVSDEMSRKAGLAAKAVLRANREIGNIQLDSETQLAGVPREAWTYKLGNRSGLEWVLDQHKEKTPKDPTIREKFNTYRFADHKDKVIGLLKRVTRVSVETMKIVEAMRAASDRR